MYTNSSFNNVAVRNASSSANGSMRRGSFDCSAQSILSAMNRFVDSVHNMQQTVLVPNRLRDLSLETPTAGSNGKQHASLPGALLNVDPYALFSMLGEVKNELLWGPSTGQSTVATMAPQHSSLNLANSSGNNSSNNSGSSTPVASSASQSTPHPLVKCQSSASLLNNRRQQQQQLVSNCARSPTASVVSSGIGSETGSIKPQQHPHHLANCCKALSNGNLTNSKVVDIPLNGCSLINSRGRLGQAMLSSDDGFGSLDSTASSSDSLSEDGAESDCDSMLLTSSSADAHLSRHHQLSHGHHQSGSMQQHCNSSHLATAFKYHLQGLHTILHQLSESADYLVDQYHQEVMQL